MEYVIRFAISLFDLAVFMYYFHSNKKMKPVSKVWIWAGFTIAAIIWTFVSSIKNPYLNLATLLIVLILLSFYYESGMWTRIINIVTFMGIVMLFEPVALLLLHAMNFHMEQSCILPLQNNIYNFLPCFILWIILHCFKTRL